MCVCYVKTIKQSSNGLQEDRTSRHHPPVQFSIDPQKDEGAGIMLDGQQRERCRIGYCLIYCMTCRERDVGLGVV